MARISTYRGTVGVIGAGRFGIALAHVIARHGHDVCLYTSLTDRADALREQRKLPRVVPELDALHPEVEVTTDAEAFAQACSLQLLTVSADFFDPVMGPLGAHLDGAHQIVHAFHTLNGPDLQTVSERVKALSCVLQVGVIAGPMHVSELLAGQPNAAVVGSPFPGIIRILRRLLGEGHIQVHGTADMRGVELAAALGQIVALLVGLADGLQLGASTHATLLTRGLRDVARLGGSLDATPETFHGLAGLGRLIDAVRRDEPNYAFGRYLAGVSDIPAALASVAPEVQGIDVARAVLGWSQRTGIRVPVVDTLDRIFTGRATPREALLALLQHNTNTRL